MENNNKSRRDNVQIQQLIYSEKHKATRVVNVGDTEVAFSLSHKEGDSIATHSASRVLTPGNHSCDDLQKFQSYGSGLVVVYANASTSCEYKVTPGQLVEFCGMSLTTDVTLVAR